MFLPPRSPPFTPLPPPARSIRPPRGQTVHIDVGPATARGPERGRFPVTRETSPPAAFPKRIRRFRDLTIRPRRDLFNKDVTCAATGS